MKTLLFLLFSGLAIAQMNPDGYIGGVSLHFTPVIDMGSADYQIGNVNAGEIEYPTAVGFYLNIAFPVSPMFSIKGFYDYRSADSEFTPNTNDYFSDKIKGSIHKFGITFSVYIK